MATKAERMRELYNKRLAKGICPRCNKTLDREGYRCIACNEKQRQMSKQVRESYKEKNKCPRCGEELDDLTTQYCQRCTLRRASFPFGKYPNEMEV